MPFRIRVLTRHGTSARRDMLQDDWMDPGTSAGDDAATAGASGGAEVQAAAPDAAVHAAQTSADSMTDATDAGSAEPEQGDHPRLSLAVTTVGVAEMPRRWPRAVLCTQLVSRPCAATNRRGSKHSLQPHPCMARELVAQTEQQRLALRRGTAA